MRALLAVAAAVLAGCQATAPVGAGTNDAFARELAGRVAGAPQTCVPTTHDQGMRVIDSRTVAYGAGSTVWVNRLDSECRALNPHNALIVDRTGGQYCRGDRVRGLETGTTIPGAACILRDWVPYRRR